MTTTTTIAVFLCALFLTGTLVTAVSSCNERCSTSDDCKDPSCNYCATISHMPPISACTQSPAPPVPGHCNTPCYNNTDCIGNCPCCVDMDGYKTCLDSVGRGKNDAPVCPKPGKCGLSCEGSFQCPLNCGICYMKSTASNKGICKTYSQVKILQDEDKAEGRESGFIKK